MTPADRAERTEETPSQPLVSNASLGGTKDPDQTPLGLWQAPQDAMPHLAWRPGPSPSGSPNEARRPASTARSHTSAWAPRHRRASNLPTNKTSPNSAPRS